MIKVKNLENIQDDDSITYERIKDFIPQKQLRTTKRITSSLQTPDYFLQKSSDQEHHDESGASSLNSQSLFIPTSIPLLRQDEINSQFTQYVQNRKRKKRQNPQLKQIISQQKIKIIVKNFIAKLLRNNINSKPIEYSPFQKDLEMSFLQKEGIELHEYINIAIAMLSVLQILILSFIYTLSIVFEQLNKMPIVQGFQSFSLGFYLIQIGVNFITVKFQQGKKLSTFREIWSFYCKDNFLIDFFSLIVLVLDLFFNLQLTIYLRLFIIVKLSQGLQKVQKLEIFFIHNFYKEQYWSLIKVFLFNFSFAHILAIFLIAMTKINETNNWMTANKQIYLAPWYEKYAWSYYWGTTMMLTVGFGDLAATTYQEAIILTFIEMISCICLAYNINCVGTLISNIRSQDVQKSKNFKIFRKLSRKNDVSEDLQWRINNYIEESSNIKKKFNYEQETVFVQKLPKGLKTQFLKESNKKIFLNLPFFKTLMQRTLFSFAEKIEMHICHPEEIIQHIDDPHNLLILKGGQIGFTCKKSGCNYNSTIIDQMRLTKQCQPILISLGFIRRSRPFYEIKSLEYSILYFLEYDSILSILKGSQMDYQLFCLLKDKCSHVPDEFQLFSCQICNGRHTKFTCPKLHFIPIRQHVTNKFIYKFKTSKNKRENSFQRLQVKKYTALKLFLDMSQELYRKQTILKHSKKLQLNLSQKTVSQNENDQFLENKSNQIIREILEMKDFFSKNTAELIKHELNKALFDGQAHDEVWIIQSDKMKNYKNYFQFDNSCNLINKFNPQKRMGTFQEAEDFLHKLRSKNIISHHPKQHQNTNKNRRQRNKLKNFPNTIKTLHSRKQRINEEKALSDQNSLYQKQSNLEITSIFSKLHSQRFQ